MAISYVPGLRAVATFGLLYVLSFLVSDEKTMAFAWAHVLMGCRYVCPAASGMCSTIFEDIPFSEEQSPTCVHYQASLHESGSTKLAYQYQSRLPVL